MPIFPLCRLPAAAAGLQTALIWSSVPSPVLQSEGVDSACETPEKSLALDSAGQEEAVALELEEGLLEELADLPNA